jgi:hypothetical protein
MSGVLERMAKRAFGRLPTVQPLIRSIYAAAPVNAGEPAAPEFLPGKVEAERAVAAPVPDPDRMSEPQPAARQRPRAVAPEVDEVAGHLNKRAEPVTPQAVRQPPQKPRVEAPPPPPTPLAPQLEPAEASANPEPLDRIASTSPIAELTLAAGASPQPVHIGQTTTPPLQRRRSRAVRAESAASAEQKSEIHISIGSIELRAAPAEPKPAASAPFRPRVSLQDFLSRKTEAPR